MKVLSLNIWAGKMFDGLKDYVSGLSNEVDIFCFQEVFSTPTENKNVNKFYRANIFEELQKVLPDHKGYFATAQEGQGFEGPAEFEIAWGLATFVRKSIKLMGIKETFIRGYKNSKGTDNTTIPRNLQYISLVNEEKEYGIANLHGLWNGSGKTDTDERIEQSKKIKAVVNGEERVIVCGDFNLLPETESLKILEENLINLIKRYGVTSTRSSLYTKPDKFADYVLISKDIRVNSFEVPSVEVSDHLPMILDFS